MEVVRVDQAIEDGNEQLQLPDGRLSLRLWSDMRRVGGLSDAVGDARGGSVLLRRLGRRGGRDGQLALLLVEICRAEMSRDAAR